MFISTLGIALYFILKDKHPLEKNKSISVFMILVSVYLMYNATIGALLNLSGHFIYGIAFIILSYSLFIHHNIFLVKGSHVS
jgi:hypothetical protein